MRIAWVVVCEAAEDVGPEERLDITGAGTPTVVAPAFPWGIELHLALCFALTQEPSGEPHRFTIDVVGPDGTTAHTQSSPIAMANLSPLFQGETEAISRSHGSISFTADTPGQYKLLFSLDGKTESEWPLNVVLED